MVHRVRDAHGAANSTGPCIAGLEPRVPWLPEQQGAVTVLARSADETNRGDYVCFRCGDQSLVRRDPRGYRIAAERGYQCYECPRCDRWFSKLPVDEPNPWGAGDRPLYTAPISYAMYLAHWGWPGGVTSAVAYFRGTPPPHWSARILLEDLHRILADWNAALPEEVVCRSEPVAADKLHQ